MARIRNVRPETWSDTKFTGLSIPARLFYIALWTFADDHGKGRCIPKELAGFAFPFDDIDVVPLLDELEESGRIVRYEVDGQPLFCVPRFAAHQAPRNKSRDSRFPDPPTQGAEQSTRTAEQNTRTAEQSTRTAEPELESPVSDSLETLTYQGEGQITRTAGKSVRTAGKSVRTAGKSVRTAGENPPCNLESGTWNLEPVTSSSGGKPPQPTDTLWEAVVAVHGQPANKSERGKFNKAHKLLRDGEVTGDEYPSLVQAFAAKHPDLQPAVMTIATRIGEMRQFRDRGRIRAPDENEAAWQRLHEQHASGALETG